MDKSVILLRSIDMLPDPRVEKYVDFYKEKGIKYKLIGWNRSNQLQQKENTVFFNLPSEFGAGVGNAKLLLKFNKFLFNYLRKSRKEYTTIHACDLDTVMPAIFIKILYGKRVVFDIFDWYSHSRTMPNKIIERVVKTCEWFAGKLSDRVIICDSERRSQIPFKIADDKLIVLPNIPQYKGEPPVAVQNRDTNKIRIAYIGIFGTFRGLEDMLEAVSKQPKVDFTIGGFGELQSLVETYSRKFANIHYIGKTSYDVSLQTMVSADLICAMYYTAIPNHIYAAPNKFYEGLYLGRAILTTKGTIPGIKCEKEKVGFAINEGERGIADFFQNTSIEEIKQRGINGSELWQKSCKNLWKHTIDNKYYKSL